MCVWQTFTALIDCADKEEDPTDALVMLLTYIEDLWEDAKVCGSLAHSVRRCVVANASLPLAV